MSFSPCKYVVVVSVTYRKSKKEALARWKELKLAFKKEKRKSGRKKERKKERKKKDIKKERNWATRKGKEKRGKEEEKETFLLKSRSRHSS